MTLTKLSLGLGVAAAVVLAAWLGGAAGIGVLAGFLAGATVTVGFLWRQRRMLRASPNRALQSVVEGFLAKLGALVIATLAFVMIPALREVASMGAFFLAFGAAVLLALLPGTFENARVLRAGQGD